MPLSTYLNLGLGELTHTKLTVELADRTVKYPKGIAENMLVGIGKFVFPIDFIILDMPEDVKLPLIIEIANGNVKTYTMYSILDELKDHCLNLKNTPYPHQRYAVYNTLVNREESTGFTSIRRIHLEDTAYLCMHFTRPQRNEDLYAVSRSIYTAYPRLCMRRSLTKELFTPFKDPERELRSSRKHLKTLSLDESRSPEFDLFYELEENSEEEVAETIEETMEQYMSKTRAKYGSGITRPKIDDKDQFELKGQVLKELRNNTFSGSKHEDANEHIDKVLEIVDLFHIPNITQD
ncbi:hypothetical protein Tco_1135987 [Tanacetum coccineum]